MRLSALAPNLPLLARLLREPKKLSNLSPEAFSTTIDAAHHARVLGWLVEQIQRGNVPDPSPEWLHDRLVTARAQADGYERAIRWEIDRIQRAFAGHDWQWILLKGAAYVAAGLPTGRGRRVADIDVLVPRANLAIAERLLKENGWQFPEISAYDERYYREWTHQLPPMVHRDRRSIVDVHHAILQQTSRLQPPSERLLERAITVDGVGVLCPSHMVLHGAAHLFHDGEIAGAIRDLFDLDQLLRCFTTESSFWSDFVAEADRLGLRRPAYYAVRYCQRWFDTPVPLDATAQMVSWAPPFAIGQFMDSLVDRAIAPDGRTKSSVATYLLFVRSHWLRMPPVHLVRHLLVKSVRGD
jgi:hypothetical protein